MKKLLRIAPVALALSVAGCAVLRKGGGAYEGTAYSDQVEFTIDNQNFYDATIYLRWNSDRRRLGNVTGFTKATFTTQWIAPMVRVEVDLLAGGTYRGDQIGVSPGERIEVQIPPQMDRVRGIPRVGRGD
jgi:hypothetical protein